MPADTAKRRSGELAAAFCFQGELATRANQWRIPQPPPVLHDEDDEALPNEKAPALADFVANDEIFLRTSLLPHAGQRMFWAALLAPSTSFSKGFPHSLH
jgi:dienelactone hydrolase